MPVGDVIINVSGGVALFSGAFAFVGLLARGLFRLTKTPIEEARRDRIFRGDRALAAAVGFPYAVRVFGASAAVFILTAIVTG